MICNIKYQYHIFHDNNYHMFNNIAECNITCSIPWELSGPSIFISTINVKTNRYIIIIIMTIIINADAMLQVM